MESIFQYAVFIVSIVCFAMVMVKFGMILQESYIRKLAVEILEKANESKDDAEKIKLLGDYNCIIKTLFLLNESVNPKKNDNRRTKATKTTQ